jgi:hypothetical protein
MQCYFIELFRTIIIKPQDLVEPGTQAGMETRTSREKSKFQGCETPVKPVNIGFGSPNYFSWSLIMSILQAVLPFFLSSAFICMEQPAPLQTKPTSIPVSSQPTPSKNRPGAFLGELTWPDAEARLIRDYKARLGGSVEIVVTQVDEIPPEKSGKFRYVVSHAANPVGA